MSEHLISPSQIATYRECERKWGWRSIAKIETPSHGSAALGTKVHSILERYLTDGTLPNFVEDGDAADIAASGLHHLPPPMTKGMSIERHFAFEAPKSGIGYQGLKDVEVAPGVAGVTDDGVPMVMDHKTTSDFKWAKTPEDLRTDPQAIIYAYDAMATYQVPTVDLVWVYYRTKGSRASKRVHLRLTSAEARPVFSEIQLQAKEMLAKRALPGEAKDIVMSLTPNPNACDSFGGCPFRHLCNLSPAQTLQSLFSTGKSGENMNTVVPSSTQDLFARLGSGTAAPPASPAAPVTDAPLPAWLNSKEPYKGAAPPAINPPESLLPAPLPASPVVADAAPPTKRQGRGKKEKPEPKEMPDTPVPVPVAAAPAPSPSVTPPAATQTGFTLYIDCAPVGFPYCPAEVLFKHARATVFSEFQLADYRFADFGKGAGMFAQAVVKAVESNVHCGQDIVLYTSSPEGSVAVSALVERAAKVVR